LNRFALPFALALYATAVGRLGERGVKAHLVELARHGDHEAFAAVTAGAVDRLYAMACLILRDPELAEDATQEALVRAWRDLPSLREPDAFESWLNRVLVRTCADLARRRRRWRAEVRLLQHEPGEPDRSSDLADRDQIERGFRRLNEAQRTILVLHFYLELTPAEVANVLAIPVGTAKSRLHYAIEALRAALAADARTSIAAVQEGRPA
jgi:RNA polymerase sigma-70 factor, ECF subfamily